MTSRKVSVVNVKTNDLLNYYCNCQMVVDVNKTSKGPKVYWAKKTDLGVEFTNVESELAYGSEILVALEDSSWLKVHGKYVIGVDYKQLKSIGRRDGKNGERNFMQTIANVNHLYDDRLTTSISAAISLSANDINTAFLVRTFNELHHGEFGGPLLPKSGQLHVLHVMVVFFLRVNGERKVVLFDPLTHSAANDVRRGNLPTVVKKLVEIWHYPVSSVISVHGEQVGWQKDCMKRSAQFIESCLASQVFFEERVLNFI